MHHASTRGYTKVFVAGQDLRGIHSLPPPARGQNRDRQSGCRGRRGRHGKTGPCRSRGLCGPLASFCTHSKSDRTKKETAFELLIESQELRSSTRCSDKRNSCCPGPRGPCWRRTESAKCFQSRETSIQANAQADPGYIKGTRWRQGSPPRPPPTSCVPTGQTPSWAGADLPTLGVLWLGFLLLLQAPGTP